jgi:hypothetical protein
VGSAARGKSPGSRNENVLERQAGRYVMDSPTVFAVLCLIGGAVVAVTLPWRLREPLGGDRLIGRVLLVLILLSFMIFLWSLGGTGIALALGWSRLANVLEGAAVFSGFAVLLFPLLAALYGVTRFLLRRRASA